MFLAESPLSLLPELCYTIVQDVIVVSASEFFDVLSVMVTQYVSPVGLPP